MNFLENIRKKPREERVKFIWIMVIVAAVFLIILWIVTWGYKKTAPKDTSVLNVLTRGLKDAKTNFNPPKK